MELEKVERFWWYHNRNHKTYKEITFWYDPETLERKETERFWCTDDGTSMPVWAECITSHNKMLDYSGVY